MKPKHIVLCGTPKPSAVEEILKEIMKEIEEKERRCGMMKCNTCKIDKEMPIGACCVWYMDNVVCGDKTTEDCTEYIPCEKEKGGAE